VVYLADEDAHAWPRINFRHAQRRACGAKLARQLAEISLHLRNAGRVSDYLGARPRRQEASGGASSAR
jgi:hypothetical protein